VLSGSIACDFRVGLLDIRLVHTSNVAEDPLDINLVRKIRVRVDAQDTEPVEAEYDVRQKGANLFSIPLGKDRIVTVEGLDANASVRSRGVSTPIDILEGTTNVYLFFSRVDRFSTPPAVVGVSEPEWSNNYKTSMSSSRIYHSATLLPDGKVLVAGGSVSAVSSHPLARVKRDSALRTIERFDPTAGAFVLEANSPDCSVGKRCMLVGMANHSASILSSGTSLLFVGGEPVDQDLQDEMVQYFDISSMTFSLAEGLSVPRARPATVRIDSGQNGILVAGGGLSEDLNSSVEIFEETLGTFEQVGDLAVARNSAKAVAYPGGVLIIGGWQQWQPERTASSMIDLLEFTESSISFSSFSLKQARAEHSAVLIGDAESNYKILVCGGLSDSTSMVDSCELVDPVTKTSQVVSGLTVDRWRHTATVLSDDRVLIAGGFSSAVDPWTAYKNAVLVQNPLEAVSFETVSMVSKRAGHTASLLPNGMVVLIGGVSMVDNTAELPVITMASEDYEIFNPR
jgi:hypothetical protein